MGQKIRPIERDYWSDDVAAASEFAIRTGQALSKGPDAYSHQFLAGGSTAGSKLKGAIPGGVGRPAHPTEGHVASSTASGVPTYPYGETG